MTSSEEPILSSNNLISSADAHQKLLQSLVGRRESFDFLKKGEESTKPLCFFSRDSLSQDIIKVTDAEPDICLEAFYALYNTLWPQIQKQPSVSLRDAWTRFIGGPLFKGILCPPEKLISERRLRDIQEKLADSSGEGHVFKDLDIVVNSILNLKKIIVEYPGELVQIEEIIESLSALKEFYLGFRNKVKELVQAIHEKEKMNASSISQYHALEDLLEPKAIMMSDIFPNHWAYRIPRSQARKLLSLDTHGRSIKTDTGDPSNHRVIALPEKSEAPEPLVYFKANGNPAIRPEKEFMLYNLYQHLQIPVPETALLILSDVFEGAKSIDFYAVQASEAVLGKSSLQACQDPETIFEQEAYISQVIGALLTNPSDGSFKNFKYNPLYRTLISIDNDEIFKPEFIGDDDKMVNIKSVLFLLPQMDNDIPKSIQTFFTTLDPNLTMLAWLKALDNQNKEFQLLFARLSFQMTRCIYQNLDPKSSTPSLRNYIQNPVQVDQELDDGSFHPKILISKDLLKDIGRKLDKIKLVLSNNRSMSAQALFEEISPQLGKYYGKLRLKFSDPEVALEALWGENKMNNCSCLLSFLNTEEVQDMTESKILLRGDVKGCDPEEFFAECRKELLLGETPLDRFIKRHRERKMNNSLNFREVLKELKLLVQEDLTESRSARHIVDFSNELGIVAQCDESIVKEINSLLNNLPIEEVKWLFMIEKYFSRETKICGTKSSAKVLGAFMKERAFILSESESRYLFDHQGNLRKNASLTGRSKVTWFPEKNPEFFLKQNPEWPGYEYASTLFMRLLGITHLPSQDLIVMNAKSETNAFPVLVTQRIDGNLVLRIWDGPQAFSNLDPYHTGLLIISAMLLNPEDGKEDNFILSPNGKYLIPIDNDHSFLPSTFQKEGSFWNAYTVNTALQTKTLLFCLDEMRAPVPQEVKQRLLELKVDKLLTEWMAELVKVEDRYINFVSHEQLNQFVENGTVLKIPFYKQFIDNIYWKAHKIQNLLETMSEPTPFDLLKAVEPFAARCYQDSFEQGKTLKDRFKAVTNQLYKKTAADGSRMSILNTQSMMEIINISEKEIRESPIFQRMGPLDALELLNQLIRERDQRSKMEQKLLFELDDKAEESMLSSFFGNPLAETALKEFFINPKDGLVLKASQVITSSKLATFLGYTPNKGIKIRFLSFPDNPSMTSEVIRTLAEGCPNLEYLNVSGCFKLKQIVTVKGEWPLLARLEAKECLSLEKFVCFSPLQVLRIGTACKIQIAFEKSLPSVFFLFMKARQFGFYFKKGQSFEIRSEQSSFLNSDFIFLEQEQFSKYLQDMKISIGTTAISSGKDLSVFIPYLDLSFQEATSQEIIESKSERLIFSDDSLVGKRNLSSLVRAKCLNLNYLNLSHQAIDDSGLETLSRGNWPLLETLDLSSTKVTTKGLMRLLLTIDWPNLKRLFFEGVDNLDQHLIESLLPEKQHLLENVDLSNTGIQDGKAKKMINKHKWPKLKYLNLSRNIIDDSELQALSQGNWPLLETLDLSHTKVTTGGLMRLVQNVDWPNLRQVVFTGLDRINQGLGHNPIEMKPSLQRLEISNEDQGKGHDRPFFKSFNLGLSELSHSGLEVFSKSEWSWLEELQIVNLNISGKEIKALANSSHLPKLKKLDLSENPILNEDFMMLASGKWPLLEQLLFYNTLVTFQGVVTLLEKIKWRNLKKLGSSLAELSSEEWHVMPEIIYLETRIRSNASDNQGLKLEVLNSKWKNLKEISLERCSGSIRSTIKIIPLKRWDQLESLSLAFPRSEGLSLVSKFTMWPLNLKVLDISRNPLGDDAIQSLFSKECPQLEDVNLQDTRITAKSLENIAKYLNLKRINISDNFICNEGLEILASGKWPLLTHLELQNTNITEKGIKSMIKIAEWPNLKILDISKNAVFTEELEVLILEKYLLLDRFSLDTKMKIVKLKSKLNKMSWSTFKEFNHKTKCFDDDQNFVDILKIVFRKRPHLKLYVDSLSREY